MDLLWDYWNENPPEHELMFAGWFEKKEKKSDAPTPEQLMAMGFKKSNKPKPKLSPITFDIPGFDTSQLKLLPPGASTDGPHN